MEKAAAGERRLQDFDQSAALLQTPSVEMLLSLAQDLPSLWNAPSTPMGVKQRIVRILIREIIVDVSKMEQTKQNVLVIHWTGGNHSELRLSRPSSGESGRKANQDVSAAIARMSARYDDAQIAMTLNRLGLPTGAGNGWSAARVCSFRHYHGMATFNRGNASGSAPLTMQQAAERLGISSTTLRRLIGNKQIEAKQVIPGGPWEIEEVEVEKWKSRVDRPLTLKPDKQESLFSNT